MKRIQPQDEQAAFREVDFKLGTPLTENTARKVSFAATANEVTLILHSIYGYPADAEFMPHLLWEWGA
ncbi:hypothetical protein [Bradyrhizobium canariense]|uniref:hypothetical protein n=1 Tax=Bradyrhizobium canariense TaxID=255045 RepID=UPI000A195842|nr:hypothetical protein [Bradyrhizobium canariense]